MFFYKNHRKNLIFAYDLNILKSSTANDETIRPLKKTDDLNNNENEEEEDKEEIDKFYNDLNLIPNNNCYKNNTRNNINLFK